MNLSSVESVNLHRPPSERRAPSNSRNVFGRCEVRFKVPPFESRAQLGRPMKGRTTNTQRKVAPSLSPSSSLPQLWRISGDPVNVDLMSRDGHLDWSRKTWQPSLLYRVARLGIMKSLTSHQQTFRLRWYDLASALGWKGLSFSFLFLPDILFFPFLCKG